MSGPRPKLFIGSSTEGLGISKAVFAAVTPRVDATIWKQGIFLPGRYPLEVLEEQLTRYDFAILVASPDDVVMKRGELLSATRDNILVEFGLFAGVLGRRHVFMLCPDQPKLDLPSDLLGLVVANYDAERSKGALSETRAAVEVACQEILEVVERSGRQSKSAGIAK